MTDKPEDLSLKVDIKKKSASLFLRPLPSPPQTPFSLASYQGRELLQTYMCQYIEVDTNDKPYDLPVSCHG